ncbi:MAG: hypothetical protein AAF694_23410 [Bacteroidota bacterium]
MAKQYDKIIQENLESLIDSILSQILQLNFLKKEKLERKHQVTIEREIDYLAKVIDHEGEEFLLHIEFQTQNEPDMAFRKAEYKAILQKEYKLPVKQFVIYMGNSPLNMPNQLPINFEINTFELVDLKSYSTNDLLSSNFPEVIIMALLGDFNGVSPDQVFLKIFSKLQKLCPDHIRLSKYLIQLGVISRLRKLEGKFLEILETMPVTYNIEEDQIYLKGIEKGIEKEKLVIVKNLLTSDLFKKGILTVQKIAELAGVSPKEVGRILEEI